MRSVSAWMVFGCLLIAIFAPRMSAQDSSPSTAGAPAEEKFGTQRNEFNIWGGGSGFSGHAWGRVQDRTLILLQLRYTRLLLASRLLAIKYSVNVAPLALLGDHKIFAATAAQQAQREYVYGGGISPVGFQFTLRRGKRVQPFIITDEGFLYFTRPILVVGSSQFNFSIDYGAGVQVFTSPDRALTLGYRYFHISNADIAVNPGTDANFFFIGFSIFR
jgi:hypothetical protein